MRISFFSNCLESDECCHHYTDGSEGYGVESFSNFNYYSFHHCCYWQLAFVVTVFVYSSAREKRKTKAKLEKKIRKKSKEQQVDDEVSATENPPPVANVTSLSFCTEDGKAEQEEEGRREKKEEGDRSLDTRTCLISLSFLNAILRFSDRRAGENVDSSFDSVIFFVGLKLNWLEKGELLATSSQRPKLSTRRIEQNPLDKE